MQKFALTLLSVIVCTTCIHVRAQVAKIKDGDKFTTIATDYIAKGNEVVLDSEKQRTINASFSEKDGIYITKSELGSNVVARKTHVMIAREDPQGTKTEILSENQFNWMPPGGDFRKPWSTSFAINNPNCGKGKMTHEASAQPIQYTVQIAGKPVELAAMEIRFNGKWDFNNHCRSGKQLERFVFSPELDLVVERDSQLYDARGFLTRGNNFKLKTMN
jgi:hypothetical protein